MTIPSSKPFRPMPHWSISAAASALGQLGRVAVRLDLGVDDDLGAGPRLDLAADPLGVGDRLGRQHPRRVVDPLTLDRGRDTAVRRRRGTAPRSPTQQEGGGQRATAGSGTVAVSDLIGRTPDRFARLDPSDELGGLLVAAEARHEVGPGDERAGLVQERQRQFQADLRPAIAGRGHRRPGLVGDRDPRHLVVQELGVPCALERQQPEQDRDREAARPEPAAGLRVHRLDLADRVERLGHDEMGAGGQLAFEAIPLGRTVGGRRVEGAGDREPGPLADRRAGAVLAPVEPGQDLDEADRVDVPDPRAGRVVADPGRVAGQGEDVPDAEGMGAEQLRLERHQVPVAGREVDEALDVEVVLDAERDRRCSPSGPGPSPSR